ncbi:MerR family transcriptional regulator [uncultured Lentibacter sp.]|uniref:MerR family transcriptional regulator n=1 Tax=uncultured Lentibacter sp. TaxID=1659309 RepID=UPI0026097845|nr:MerR family transcriptional regulator [uncultured Lentibacter sp.]
MAKSADAFRTISEVAEWLDLPTHVLRFWESKFTQVKPVKRAGGRRYYRPNDMALLGGIKKLLHDDGMTIKGAQKMLRDHGVKHISSLSQPLDPELSDAEFDTGTLDAAAAPVSAPADVPPASDSPAPSPAAPPAPEAAPADDTDTTDEADEPDEADETEANPGLTTEPPALPGFLQPAKDASPETATAAPVSLAISLPPDPDDTELEVSAGLLSRIAAYKSAPTEELRRVLQQARADLRALSS